MRVPAFLVGLALVPLAACGGTVRVAQLGPGTGGNFTFTAATNTVMTENDDGAAERIRRDWLAESLAFSGTCHFGYVIDHRRFVQPQEGLFGNGGDIVYDGHCL